MRAVAMKKVVLVGTLAFSACALFLASVMASSLSAPRASLFPGKALFSPLAMMAQAPSDLPIEQYDSH